MTPIDIDIDLSTPPPGNVRLSFEKRGLSFTDPDGVHRRCVTAPLITLTTPLTGATITPLPMVDETNYITPAGTLATLLYPLPAAENSVLGQIKKFQSSTTITALTVSVAGSGTVAGTALTAMVAGTTYEFQCISIVGTVATWLRIR